MHRADDDFGMIHFSSSVQGAPTASYSSPLPHEHHSPTWLRASNPTGSSTGRASMSVRSMTTGRPLPMVATIPVVARPDLNVVRGRIWGLGFRMSDFRCAA